MLCLLGSFSLFQVPFTFLSFFSNDFLSVQVHSLLFKCVPQEPCIHKLSDFLSEQLSSQFCTHWEKKESQNGSPRRAIWLSVTQLSLELHFGAKHYYEEKKRLSSTKESRFSKLLSKRAILALFFFSVRVFLLRVFFSEFWAVVGKVDAVKYGTNCNSFL